MLVRIYRYALGQFWKNPSERSEHELRIENCPILGESFKIVSMRDSETHKLMIVSRRTNVRFELECFVWLTLIEYPMRLNWT